MGRRNGTSETFWCRRNWSRRNGTNHRQNGNRRNGSRRNGNKSFFHPAMSPTRLLVACTAHASRMLHVSQTWLLTRPDLHVQRLRRNDIVIIRQTFNLKPNDVIIVRSKKLLLNLRLITPL